MSDFDPVRHREQLNLEAMERAQRSASMIDKGLFKRVAEALWETQWTTRWAAENTVCAYDCGDVRYEDQRGHSEKCEFVKLWAELKPYRLEVGVTDEPTTER